MASTEVTAVARLLPDQAERALPLSVEAGWNQLVADWRFMLEAGAAFGVAEGERWIASALELPLGPALSWISMVLVTQDRRRLGLGTKLLQRCLDQAPRAAGLDATEFGRPVYLPLGFRDLYRISRYRLEAVPPAVAPPVGVEMRPLRAADMAQLAAWDSERSAMARGPILAHLQARMPALAWAAWRGDRLAGYVLGRDGRLTTQIGPIVAADDDIAIALCAKAMSAAKAPFFIDAVDQHRAFCRWLEQGGAVAPRFFIRMVRGEMPGLERADWIYAIAGPELG